MNPRAKKYIQIAISFALIFALLIWVDYSQLISSLSKADFRYLAAAVALVLLNRILMPVKWNLLLLAKKVDIGISESIKIYFISSFLGFYLPPTIGSDFVRAYLVKRHGYNFPDIISSILVERLLGLIALLLFGVSGCLLFYLVMQNITIELNRILMYAVAAAVLVIGLFFLSLNKFLGDALLRLINRHKKSGIIDKIIDAIGKLHESYIQYFKHKTTLLIFFILTCVEVSLPIIRSYFVSLAFNVHVPMIYFFAFVPIILLLIRLPISVDGFGIHEGGYVYFLALLGVSNADGFSIGLINHLIFLIGILPGGFFYMLLKSTDRQKIRRGEIKDTFPPHP